MKRYFKDFYGTTASISQTKMGFRLVLAGRNWRETKTYETERGARIAMGKALECWKEVEPN